MLWIIMGIFALITMNAAIENAWKLAYIELCDRCDSVKTE